MNLKSGYLLHKKPFLCLFLLLGIVACAPKSSFKLNNSEQGAKGPDPFFGYQWFLGGTKLSSTVNIGADIVWASGNMGQDVRIAVVDPSSIYLSHLDLSANKDLGKSFNFIVPSRGTDTTVNGLGSHGTCAAGVIAARDENSEGIRGIASRAGISARTLSGLDTDIFEALTYKYQDTDVSSNSYGPPDNSAELNQYYATGLFDQAIASGTASGRGGLGTVFVWAAGNGRQYSDRSNYDGYASHYGVMSICSVDENGVVSSFSEPGSNLWICAPGEKIPTTDYLKSKCGSGEIIGDDLANTNYTQGFTGTSAAAPVAAGVVGLILSEAKLKKISLGWRDVKMILAETATQPISLAWQPTRIGFNDDMGFGLINASAAVQRVSSWTPVGNSSWTTKILGTGFLGPTGSGDIDEVTAAYLPMKSFTVNNASPEDGVSIFNSTITYLEFITLEVKLTHDDPGDLEISLTRTPLGGGAAALSKVTRTHSCFDPDVSSTVPCASALNYRFEFGISNFLGESAEGVWGLKIKDGADNGSIGTVIGWRLKFYGH